jgi:8-oxo-dGTP diphosphatase
MAKELKYCYEYPRFAHTVDAIIIANIPNGAMVLLIQRKFEPFKGMWALPGGFIEMDETLLEACQRELREETGLEGLELNQFYTFDEVGRDPRHRTVSTAFYGLVPEILSVTGGDDAARAEWFPTNALPDMAFDHGVILRKFLLS